MTNYNQIINQSKTFQLSPNNTHSNSQNDTAPEGAAIFGDIDYAIKFDFSHINGDFYMNNLRLVDLHSYQAEFDREGIELFFLSSVSEFLFKSDGSASTSIFNITTLVLALCLFLIRE